MCDCVLSGIFAYEKRDTYPEETDSAHNHFIFLLPIEAHVTLALIVLDSEMVPDSLSGHVIHFISTDNDSGDTFSVYEFRRQDCIWDIEAMFLEMFGPTYDGGNHGI